MQELPGLTLPQLVPGLCAELGLDTAQTKAIREALDTKDIASLNAMEGDHIGVFQALLAAAGPADRALEKLAAVGLPAGGQQQVDELSAFVSELRSVLPDATITIDPGEFRHFEYHTGLCFTLFAGNGDGAALSHGLSALMPPEG